MFSVNNDTTTEHATDEPEAFGNGASQNPF